VGRWAVCDSPSHFASPQTSLTRLPITQVLDIGYGLFQQVPIPRHGPARDGALLQVRTLKELQQRVFIDRPCNRPRPETTAELSRRSSQGMFDLHIITAHVYNCQYFHQSQQSIHLSHVSTCVHVHEDGRSPSLCICLSCLSRANGDKWTRAMMEPGQHSKQFHGSRDPR
jgi:hypothetical protein